MLGNSLRQCFTPFEARQPLLCLQLEQPSFLDTGQAISLDSELW